MVFVHKAIKCQVRQFYPKYSLSLFLYAMTDTVEEARFCDESM